MIVIRKKKLNLKILNNKITGILGDTNNIIPNLLTNNLDYKGIIMFDNLNILGYDLNKISYIKKIDRNTFDSDKKKETKSKNAVRGENIETEINISLEDAFYGNDKQLGLRTVEGKIKTFVISVPPGIQNNEKIRLVGQGKLGKGGGKNGDLFIKVKIDDNDTFKLDGFNLRTNLYLTPWEAALSTKVMVKTIDEELAVYIPSGIQSGEEIKIENKGYKDGRGGRGDLILETKIMIPKNPNEKELNLFKQLKEESRFNPRNIA